MKFNEMRLIDVVKDFKYNYENSNYINDKIGLEIIANNSLRHFIYKGIPQNATYKTDRQTIVLDGEEVDTFVILAGLFLYNSKDIGPKEEWLLNQPIKDLETYNDYSNSRMNYDHSRVHLQHRCVDWIDLNAYLDGYKLWRNFKKTKTCVSETLGTTVGTIWDMINPPAALRYGYHGVFLRSHVPDYIEPLELPKEVLDNPKHYSNAVNSLGCYLVSYVGNDQSLSKYKDKVFVCQGLNEVVNLMSSLGLNNLMSLEDLHTRVQGFMVSRRRADQFFGYKIRKIDDVHDQLIRFSEVKLAREVIKTQ